MWQNYTSTYVTVGIDEAAVNVLPGLHGLTVNLYTTPADKYRAMTDGIESFNSCEGVH